MPEQKVIEAEYIPGTEGDPDPDLNQAWFEFRDEIDRQANSTGSIAVFEVPVDATGVARPKTLNKTRLFTVPVGTMTLDDVCDRVIKEFMSPGQRMMVQLLGTIEGRRGIALNKMIPLRRANELATQPADTSIEGIVRLIQEQAANDRREMRAMLQEVMAARAPAPSGDPFAFGMKMAEQITAMAAAVSRGGAAVAAPAPQMDMAQNMMQMLTLMTALKKWFGNDQPAPADKSPDPSEFLAIVKEVGGIVRPLMESHAAEKTLQAANAQRALAHERPAETAAPAKSDEAPPETPLDTKEALKMRLMKELAEVLPTLCSMAERKADIAKCAKLAASSMPDDTGLNDALYTLVSDDSCVAQLAELHPPVKDFAEWFEAFRLELKKEFEPDTPA